MKNDRLKRIRELLETENLRTQSEISQRLIEEGYNATQATVSRDLKELSLSKTGGKRAGSYRIKKINGKTSAEDRYDDMRQYIVSIKSAMNIIVVKTAPGFAQAIASSVDNLKRKHILGCVAGDDTIIIVTTDAVTANRMVYKNKFFSDTDDVVSEGEEIEEIEKIEETEEVEETENTEETEE